MPARACAVLVALGATLCAALLGAHLQRADRQEAEPLAMPRHDGSIAHGPNATGSGADRHASETPRHLSFTGRSAEIATLASALTSADANARIDAIADAGASANQHARDLLAHAAVHDGDPGVRAEAVRAFALIHASTQDQDDVFTQALADADPDVRGAAIAALESIASESSVRSLALALDDAEPSLRARAADALGELGGEDAHNLLLRALTDENSAVRETAAARLAERYPDVYAAARPDPR